MFLFQTEKTFSDKKFAEGKRWIIFLVIKTENYHG